MEEEQLTQNIEEELEEEETIQPIDDEPSSPEEPPLICDHLPFGEMEPHLHLTIESWMFAISCLINLRRGSWNRGKYTSQMILQT